MSSALIAAAFLLLGAKPAAADPQAKKAEKVLRGLTAVYPGDDGVVVLDDLLKGKPKAALAGWTVSHVRFSPDGQRMAFLATRASEKDAPANVYLAKVKGAGLVAVTEFPEKPFTTAGGASGVDAAYDWSPNGSRLAVAVSAVTNVTVDAKGERHARLHTKVWISDLKGRPQKVLLNQDGQRVFTVGDGTGPQPKFVRWEGKTDAALQPSSVSAGPSAGCERTTPFGPEQMLPDGKRAWCLRLGADPARASLEIVGLQPPAPPQVLAPDLEPSFLPVKTRDGRWLAFVTADGRVGVAALDGTPAVTYAPQKLALRRAMEHGGVELALRSRS